MQTFPHQLHGWGYEGQTVEDLITFASGNRIEVIFDVRLNPISRKRGFSKRGLSEALTAAGLVYLHRPALGNPRDNRDGFASPESCAGKAAHDRFRTEVLDADEAQDAIYELSVALTRSSVALLCYEADQRRCHRRLVIDAIADLGSSVLVG